MGDEGSDADEFGGLRVRLLLDELGLLLDVAVSTSGRDSGGLPVAGIGENS